jgi:HD-GYP domain-containing protein (c-di-GMP phosphodiesterase class II)
MKIDSYDSPDAEALLSAGEERLARRLQRRRELITNCVGAAGFLVSAALLAVLAPWHKSLSLGAVVLVLFTWAVIERVKFPVAGGWCYPTELVFLPALFILPTPVVPLIAMVAILLRRAPHLLRGEVKLRVLPVFIADAWFTIGPALVIVLAGAETFSWTHWPVYIAAILAQVLFDMIASIAWSWIGEGIDPRVQLPLLVWVYLVDLTLAPLGLVIASASVDRPALVLIALSPTVLFTLFARERQQRLDQTLALSTAYRGTALLLGDVVEADDHYTGMHSRDVVDLSVTVADALELDGQARRNVELAALLHDVGKIRVPKEIINKPGSLDPVEWEIVKRHTIDGEQMLRQVGGTLASVGRIVRHSHEDFDGSGYPDGLSGEEIPIESRIVCACDAYSAMTTDRSYRAALSEAEALAELRRCAGTQFDPRVVAAIDRLVSARAVAAPGATKRRWSEKVGATTLFSRTGKQGLRSRAAADHAS